VHGGLAPGDHHPFHPFPEFFQPPEDIVKRYVLHGLGMEHQVPVVTKRATEIAASGKYYRRELRLPVDEARLNKTFDGKIRQNG
jgi:hypothetical protein